MEAYLFPKELAQVRFLLGVLRVGFHQSGTTKLKRCLNAPEVDGWIRWATDSQIITE